jgi:hypothetical protein
LGFQTNSTAQLRTEFSPKTMSSKTCSFPQIATAKYNLQHSSLGIEVLSTLFARKRNLRQKYKNQVKSY